LKGIERDSKRRERAFITKRKWVCEDVKWIEKDGKRKE
jgi:hypothetical protein